MDFVIGLAISTDWKYEKYDSILMIIDYLTKMVYKPVKITIDVPGLAEVIINVVVYLYGIPKSILTDCSLLFTFEKFWFSL